MSGAPDTTRALDAVAEAAYFLGQAHGAVRRAQVELHGDAASVAERLSLQLQYLRKVADVLRHEIERLSREGLCEPPAKRLPAARKSLTR